MERFNNVYFRGRKTFSSVACDHACRIIGKEPNQGKLNVLPIYTHKCWYIQVILTKYVTERFKIAYFRGRITFSFVAFDKMIIIIIKFI